VSSNVTVARGAQESDLTSHLPRTYSGFKWRARKITEIKQGSEIAGLKIIVGCRHQSGKGLAGMERRELKGR